jgi:hypothetical protein
MRLFSDRLLEKLKAYYPDSKYVSRLESVLAEMTDEEIKLLLVRTVIENIIDSDGRFYAGENGIVLDTDTDLVWVVGPDRDTYFDDAKSWVENLSVAGGGWRMPTLRELQTLYQRGAGSKNMTPLLQTTAWWVWSGQRHETRRIMQYVYAYNWGRKFDIFNDYDDGQRFTDGPASYYGRRGFAVRSRR